MLEPLFVKYGVSVVFAGHDHFYERTKPQKGIVHFVDGSGGQLRKGNIDRRSGLTAAGFDTDQAFLVAEIDGDELFFNAISRAGAVVDSGIITRRNSLSDVLVLVLVFLLRLRFSGASPPTGCLAQSASKTRLHLFGDPRVGDDHADLAPAVELQLAQALAADEAGRAVADDGPHVQAQVGQLAGTRPR